MMIVVNLESYYWDGLDLGSEMDWYQGTVNVEDICKGRLEI